MKLSVSLSIFLFLWISAGAQKDISKSLKDFNNFLGKEKASAFDKAVVSFDKFLLVNFPDINNESDRIKSYLKYLQENFSENVLLKYDKEENKKILEEWEATGLRKDMWLYINEEYEPKYYTVDFLKPDNAKGKGKPEVVILSTLELEEIEVEAVDTTGFYQRQKKREEERKNSLCANNYGKYVFGLFKYASDDKAIRQYVEIKTSVGDLSPMIYIGGFLENFEQFDNPFVKRMIIVEIHFWLMKGGIGGRE